MCIILHLWCVPLDWYPLHSRNRGVIVYRATGAVMYTAVRHAHQWVGLQPLRLGMTMASAHDTSTCPLLQALNPDPYSLRSVLFRLFVPRYVALSSGSLFLKRIVNF